MKVRDYMELTFHPCYMFVIESARTGKVLLDGRRDSYFGKLTKKQKEKLDKYIDWEVSCVVPFVKQTSDGYFSLGIKLLVPEWNGEQ